MESEEWRNEYPEELRGVVDRYDSPVALAKAYREMETFQGQSLRIPGENASAGDQEAFYTKVMDRVPGLVRKPSDDESTSNFWKSMGRPEDIDGYAEVAGMTPDQTEFMRGAALEANMTNEQFRKFSEKFADRASTEQQTAQLDRNEQLGALHQEWGVAKDQKMTAIKMMAQQLSMDESLMGDIVSDTPNPQVLRLMDTIVQKIGSEGGAMQQQVGDNGNAVMTPQEAEMQIEEIMGNTDHDFWHPSRPGNKVAKDRVLQLQTYATPGASTTMASQRAGYGSVRAKDSMF